MASRGYIAIGHGWRGDHYDPGAVNQSRGLIENDLAGDVVEATAAALERMGVADLIVERNGGSRHDPGLAESIRRVNASGAEWAVEVHFNAGGGTGSECWVHSRGGAAERLARRIQRELPAALELPDRGVKTSTYHGFTRETRCPAVIVEVAFVDGDGRAIDRGGAGFLRTAGEAIARGIAGYLNIQTRPEGEDIDMTPDELRQIVREEVQREGSLMLRRVVKAVVANEWPSSWPAEWKAAYQKLLEGRTLDAIARNAASAGGSSPAPEDLTEAVKQALREGTDG